MYVVARVPRVRRDVFTREHMGISVQRATTNVCLPGTAPIWGGGGREEDGEVVCSRGSKELSSASVPQDKLQLSPRGHEKQSELSPLPWTYLRL